MSSHHADLFPTNARQSGNHLFRLTLVWALRWAIVLRDFRYLLVLQARHLGLGYLGKFAMAYLGFGRASPAPPLSADVEVVEALAVAGMPQLTATLADRDARPPLRAPLGGAPVRHSSTWTGSLGTI